MSLKVAAPLLVLFMLISGCIGNSQQGEAVIVTSSPAGAEVYIDGNYTGDTPLEISGFPSGSHTIEMRKMDYLSCSALINITKGQGNSVHCDLIPDDGENNQGTMLTASMDNKIIKTGEKLVIEGYCKDESPDVIISISGTDDSDQSGKTYTMPLEGGAFVFGLSTETLIPGDYKLTVRSKEGAFNSLNFSVPDPTQSPEPEPLEDRTYVKTYEWNYSGDQWSWILQIPEDSYEYFRNKPHNREDNYAQYALSNYDRSCIQYMVRTFRDSGQDKGYSDRDVVQNVVSFVQSLPYTADDITTGYDEYPRYPIETLVDGGGDCEDTAILTAALLNEMGYGAVILELPGHMAVGVRGDSSIEGSYYIFEEVRYYYLETTNSGWDIGQIPDEYKDAEVNIRPMVQVPRMSLTFSAKYYESDSLTVSYKVICSVENIGSGTALNPAVSIAARINGETEDKDYEKMIRLEDYPEGATGTAWSILTIPRGESAEIICTLSGDNFRSVEKRSNLFDT